MRPGLLYISVAQSSFESQISFVTLRVQRSVCINLYKNILKKLIDPPSLLCQIYADPPFLGRQKVNDPPLNSSGPPPLLKNECSLKTKEYPWTWSMTGGPWNRSKVGVQGLLVHVLSFGSKAITRLSFQIKAFPSLICLLAG